MKLKNLCVALLAIIAGLTTSYLIGVFVAWEFNPGKWEAGGRVLWGIFSLVWSLIFLACSSGEIGRKGG